MRRRAPSTRPTGPTCRSVPVRWAAQARQQRRRAVDRGSLVLPRRTDHRAHPSTAAQVVRLLGRLTRRGVDRRAHDARAGGPRTLRSRSSSWPRDGHLAFVGTPGEARSHFGVDDLADIYDQLAGEDAPRACAARFAAWRAPTAWEAPTAAPTPPPARPDGRRAVGVLRQWSLLTRREAGVLVRNGLSLVVLLGSPALVTAMTAMLFRPGAFEPQGQADLGPAQTVFRIASPASSSASPTHCSRSWGS